jgi:hypothetical protein
VNPSVEGRVVALAVLGAVVDAIATKAAAQLDFAAPPPDPRNLSSTAEAFLTRLDGSRFEAPTRAGTELAKRLERWAKPATDAPAGRLVVQLDPPDKGDAWYLSVQGPNPDGRLVPVEVAIVDHRALADQLTRLERLLPLLRRPGGKRVGEVVLNQAEAWELMTVTGPTLEAAGFTVRVPALSRRKPSPSVPTSSRPSAGRRCSTTSSSAPPRSTASPPRRGRSCARTAPGSSSTRPTWPKPPRRSPSAPRSRS